MSNQDKTKKEISKIVIYNVDIEKFQQKLRRVINGRRKSIQ